MDKKARALRNRLSYCEKTGDICSQESGKSIVFNAVDTHGYKRLRFSGVDMLAHRVAWCLHRGEWPKGEIDHINGDKTDNRIANLRVVSRSENMKNLPKTKANKSGITGIHWEKSRKKWRVAKSFDGKQILVGRFSCIAHAVKAELEARAAFGYSPNHGRG